MLSFWGMIFIYRNEFKCMLACGDTMVFILNGIKRFYKDNNKPERTMKRMTLMVTALIFAFASTVSLAETIKIGVVDLQKIMRESSQMKAIQTDLEKKFKPRRDKLVEQEQKVKADMDKFKRDQSVMNEKQRFGLRLR